MSVEPERNRTSLGCTSDKVCAFEEVSMQSVQDALVTWRQGEWVAASPSRSLSLTSLLLSGVLACTRDADMHTMPLTLAVGCSTTAPDSPKVTLMRVCHTPSTMDGRSGLLPTKGGTSPGSGSRGCWTARLLAMLQRPLRFKRARMHPREHARE